MKAVTDENTPISRAVKDHGVPVSRQNFWKGVMVTNQDLLSAVEEKELQTYWWKLSRLGMQKQRINR